MTTYLAIRMQADMPLKYMLIDFAHTQDLVRILPGQNGGCKSHLRKVYPQIFRTMRRRKSAYNKGLPVGVKSETFKHTQKWRIYFIYYLPHWTILRHKY